MTFLYTKTKILVICFVACDSLSINIYPKRVIVDIRTAILFSAGTSETGSFLNENNTLSKNDIFFSIKLKKREHHCMYLISYICFWCRLDLF